MNKKIIDVALGKSPADLVIQNGRLVNVITREIYKADVAIADGLIAAVGDLEAGTIGPATKIVDAGDKYLAPGFIDAHIHFESSMLAFSEFARAVLPRGTTAVASDLMEIAIVSGLEGIREIFREAEGLPLTLLHTVPSFMSEEGEMQTIGAALYPQLIEELLKKPQAVGLAEVMVEPILAKSGESEAMLKLAAELGKTAEGHAPELYGAALNAYSGAGVRSDHESTNRAEALEKARHGIRVLMREGSAAADLLPCLDIITKDHVDPRYCSMVSDDIDMLHIFEKGHLDHKVRMAVSNGVDPVTAIQMITINPAESLKVDGTRGSITPGKTADIVLLSSLEQCTVESVIAKGEIVVEQRKTVFNKPSFNYAACMLNTVHLKKPLVAADMVIPFSGASKAKVHLIGAKGTTLLTDRLEAELPVVNGFIAADTKRDILHIACVERYGKNGGIGRSFITGFGLKSGAIATSVGHDHHNITVVGSDAADMAAAVNRIAALNGALVLAETGKVIYELPLPVCGLLCDMDFEKSSAVLAAMQAELRARGCDMASPFMTLAFITLIFIPAFGISDRGLVDVQAFKVVDPVISISN
jgi:adenine deaminase